MKSKVSTTARWACVQAVFLSVSLAACGGGGGGGEVIVSPPATPAPAPAPAPAPEPAPAPAPAPAQAPTIVMQPASTSVPEGEPAIWTVQASGTAPFTYQWMRNGASISGATSTTYALSSTGQLDDRAVFSVQVSNAAGSVTSATATLSVQAAMGNTLAALAGEMVAPGSAIPPPIDGVGSAARFGRINAMASDKQGNLFVVEDTVVRKVTNAGVVTTVAGKADAWGSTDGLAASATFGWLLGVAVADDGTIYVADAGNRSVRSISPQGHVQTIAGGREKPGNLDGPSGIAQFSLPMALALDAQGALYVLDGKPEFCLDDNSGPGSVPYLSSLYVRKVDAGQVQTVPATTLTPPVVTQSPGPVFIPGGLALDREGNIYVGVNTAPGVSAIFAVGCGSFRKPSIASYVRKVSRSGEATIFAGSSAAAGFADGPAAAARFGWIVQMGFDGFGALYVSDVDNRTVRRIDPSGVVTTPIGVAGWDITRGPYGPEAQVETLGLGPLPGRLMYAPALAILPNNAISVAAGSYWGRVVLRTERR